MCDYQGYEFGANYLDSVCFNGFLWNADSGYPEGDGWVYTNGGDIPCPMCNRRFAISRLAESFRTSSKRAKNAKWFWNRARRAINNYLKAEGTGTVLEGKEYGKVERIKITAVGEDKILAICSGGYETLWSLRNRDWRKVGDSQ